MDTLWAAIEVLSELICIPADGVEADAAQARQRSRPSGAVVRAKKMLARSRTFALTIGLSSRSRRVASCFVVSFKYRVGVDIPQSIAWIYLGAAVGPRSRGAWVHGLGVGDHFDPPFFWYVSDSANSPKRPRPLGAFYG